MTKMNREPKNRVVRRFKQREVVHNTVLDGIDVLCPKAFAGKLEQSEDDDGTGSNDKVDGVLFSLLFENKLCVSRQYDFG